MAREALGVVGAAVGYVVSGYNPQGALIGWQVGYGVGSYLDPTQIPAPGLSDAPLQTSRDGIPITLFWGLQYGHGNILQKNPEEIVTTKKRQGKGGSTEVEEKSRFRTFAIGIGYTSIGPIAGLTRIWEDNKLVYDVSSSPRIPAAESTKYAEGFRLYLGDESQLQDPDLEAHWGPNETPYYRGLAYILFINKDLTNLGGRIPQFAFEVNGSADASVTSKVYPIEAIDGLAGSIPGAEAMVFAWPPEGIDSTQTPVGGEIMSPLLTYDIPAEGIDSTQDPNSGTLRVALQSYTSTAEGVDSTQVPVSGTLRVALITYSNWEPEGIDSTQTPIGGTLV